jgi:hypothetical protein
MNYARTAVASLLFFAAVFTTAYFSMTYLSLQPSSSCMDCSYLKDVLVFSSISLVVIPLMMFIQKKTKIGNVWISLIIGILFFVVVFFINLSIFQDRESSWSSYSTEDELLSVFFESYLYLIFGGIVISVVFYQIFKSWERKNS